MANVNIKFNNKDYLLSCDDGQEESLRKLTKFLDKKYSELKDKFKNIGAFQTRNIPHLGHEKIIEVMLENCDAVVINPIIGPKKQGDVNTQKLGFIYDNILKH